jgi:hypothetical protein
VREDGLIPLNCRIDVLTTLSTAFDRFGRVDAQPDWLVSGVWLCAADEHFLATASLEVLPDGFLARPLSIERPAEVIAQVAADLPDIEGRLLAHGNDLVLPQPHVALHAPEALARWEGRYRLVILVRATDRAASTHRVACALLFLGDDGRALLVGTDPSTTLAMVLSEDRGLIDAYRSGCEEHSLGGYLQRLGA